jgi:peptidoglycan/xylan/chitin deacetylase (PgdA/CDA1 family)
MACDIPQAPVINMSALLTVIVYHYVRPIRESAFPEIKGLELSAFEEQLDYIVEKYQIVSAAQVLEAAFGGQSLPDSPMLLTFDDGYSDHYRYVFPALMRRKMSGVFFPPGCAVKDRTLLDVHKLHFLLASGMGIDFLVEHIENEVNSEKENYVLRPLEEYRKEYRKSNRFDSANVIYVKRMLQSALPEKLRSRITAELFNRFVSCDDQSFADELYLSTKDLKQMAEAGMEIGSHGYGHYWLNSLSPDKQAEDIDLSLEFLSKVGAKLNQFLFCFPYGAYNQDTLSILRKRDCGAAFTTHASLVDLSKCNMLELPRLDTNDLPEADRASSPQKKY